MKSLGFVCMMIVVLCMSQMLPITVMAEDSSTTISDVGSKIEQYALEHADTTAGMSVAVFDETETIYRNHFGYMDVKNKLPVTEDTVMEWGSVSKLLVWISVMQLAEQGKIELEADVRNYLPEGFLRNLKYDAPVTMLHLMNHNAGFEESVIGMATDKEDRILPLEEYLMTIQPRQFFEPGTVCAYSNWGTTLAAYIVERVSGVPYHDYVRTHIFEPLDMNDASICPDMRDHEDVKNRRMALKVYTRDVKEITPNMTYIVMYPAGACISTIEDMQKFAQSLLSEDTVLFSEKATYHKLFSPSLYYEGTDIPRNYHGFWNLGTNYGTDLIGHGGNTAGCSSYLMLDMNNKVGMVIQTNQSSEKSYNIEMPAILFGKYEGTASDYEGLTMSARTIFHGPLKIYQLMSVSSAKPSEPVEAYDVRTDENKIDKISAVYGDVLVIGIKDILADIIVIGLYILTLVFCIVNMIRYAVKGLYNKIRGKHEKKGFGLWYITGTLFPLFPIIVFSFIVPTLFNYQQWCISGYRIALFLIFLSALLMSALVVYGFVKQKRIAVKKVQKIEFYFVNVCMTVTIANIIYWNWGMFWLI